MLILFVFSVLILIGSLLKERKLEQQYFEVLEGDNLSNEKEFEKALNICIFGKILSCLMTLSIISYFFLFETECVL